MPAVRPMRFARVDTRKSWLPVRRSRYTTCLPIKPHQRDEPGTSWMHLEKPETPRRSDRRGTSAFATRGSLREIRTRIRRQQRVQISSSFSVARIFLPPLRAPFPATTLVSLNRACTTFQPGRFLASSRFRCRGYRSRERPMHTVLAIQPIWRTS